MRRSFDGLSAMVRNHMGADPTGGHWFVFVNRRRTLLKVLAFDGDGYWIWSKRLEAGQFAAPVKWTPLLGPLHGYAKVMKLVCHVLPSLAKAGTGCISVQVRICAGGYRETGIPTATCLVIDQIQTLDAVPVALVDRVHTQVPRHSLRVWRRTQRDADR